MIFCTNCGHPVRTGTSESQIPTAPKVDIPSAATLARPSDRTKKAKLGFGALLGCLGLTVIAAVGLIAAVIYAGSLQNSKFPDRAPNSDDNSISLPSEKDRNPSSDRHEAETHLLEIMNDRREAGRFKQISVKNVPAKDYFPRALGAAQASYHNGSRYVSVSIGKYPDFELAKKDFDEQFASVRKKGGEARILSPAADGTIHGVYQHKGNSYAEYCTPSAFCYRLASADPKSLKYFIENFITL